MVKEISFPARVEFLAAVLSMHVAKIEDKEKEKYLSDIEAITLKIINPDTVLGRKINGVTRRIYDDEGYRAAIVKVFGEEYEGSIEELTEMVVARYPNDKGLLKKLKESTRKLERTERLDMSDLVSEMERRPTQGK